MTLQNINRAFLLTFPFLFATANTYCDGLSVNGLSWWPFSVFLVYLVLADRHEYIVLILSMVMAIAALLIVVFYVRMFYSLHELNQTLDSVSVSEVHTRYEPATFVLGSRIFCMVGSICYVLVLLAQIRKDGRFTNEAVKQKTKE